MARVKNGSRFVGRALGYWGRYLAVVFLTIITLTLGLPWINCWFQRWVVGHTEIDGRKLYFDGTGWQMVGTYIKWMLLTCITCGLFLFWMPVRAMHWNAKHIHFAD